LTNKHGDYFRFGLTAWHKMLDLAAMHGWEPAGTLMPEHWTDPDYDWPEWGGGYTTNEYQRVTAEDAAALADALESALDDLPDVETANKMTDRVPATGDGPLFGLHKMLREIAEAAGENPEEAYTAIMPDADLSPVDFYSGAEHKDKLRAFIAYCRDGEFNIG